MDRHHSLTDTPLPTIVCDDAGCVQELNQAATILFGYQTEELAGTPLMKIVLPESRMETADAQLRAALGIGKDGQGFKTNFRLVHQVHDSKSCWIATFFQPAESAEIEAAIEEDLQQATTSQLRELAESLEQTQLEYERQSVKLQLQADELEQARRELQRAVSSKCDFISKMSHEIRTPMTSILGFAEVLLDEADSAGITGEMRMAIDTIHRNGEKLVHLLNDILELSKMEAGQLKPSQRESRPQDIAEEVRTLMEPAVFVKGLTFKTLVDSQVPEKVLIDHTRVRQVLMTLVENAVKFTSHGGIEIRIFFDARANHLHCSVKDTGSGMTQQQMEELFRPFVSTSPAKELGGGLGLHICHRMVEMLGGTIRAESELGSGSTFHFNVIATPVEASQPIAEVRPVDLDGLPLQDVNILLVEDGPDNQKLIERLLVRAGANVQIAENGAIALEKLLDPDGRPRTSQRTDLVFMDVQMPVMDGIEATRRLRAAGFDRPIIALTAHVTSDHRDRCISAGCNSFATKPIRKQELIQAATKELVSQSVS